MKKFLIVHVGFEKPTPEVMAAWMAWFEGVASKQLDQGGFARGREITKQGSRDLPWDDQALTGYNILQAESLEAAEALARTCPFITGIRVYELR